MNYGYNIGRHWINNEKTNKFITQENLRQFLDEGWNIGKVKQVNLIGAAV